MKKNLKNRWLIVGAVWLAALSLTVWNVIRVDGISSAQQTNDRLQREKAFQQRHHDQLKHVETVYDSLFLNVESLNLGLITLRGDVLALAAAFGMTEAILSSDPAQASEDQIPLTLRVRGPFRKTAEFLSVLEKIPYLRITRSFFKVMAAGGTETEITLTLRFKVKPQTGPAVSPQQALSHLPASGAEPL